MIRLVLLAASRSMPQRSGSRSEDCDEGQKL